MFYTIRLGERSQLQLTARLDQGSRLQQQRRRKHAFEELVQINIKTKDTPANCLHQLGESDGSFGKLLLCDQKPGSPRMPHRSCIPRARTRALRGAASGALTKCYPRRAVYFGGRWSDFFPDLPGRY
ncbi:hypothetical protein NDU88_005777 [Pleurodeles waltl]|uniref:Uncharacterized protein n=1 Tax=Pleurodeles waltl TaxID=8319 RepID=A0AAV7PJU8_PLEWA|nr:hypothetical protein NDU88_005777 [Pleurodeles waltl]